MAEHLSFKEKRSLASVTHECTDQTSRRDAESHPSGLSGLSGPYTHAPCWLKLSFSIKIRCSARQLHPAFSPTEHGFVIVILGITGASCLRRFPFFLFPVKRITASFFRISNQQQTQSDNYIQSAKQMSNRLRGGCNKKRKTTAMSSTA